MTSESNNPPVIALVEDDPAYRSLIEDFLQYQGMQVVSFSEPESFLGSLGQSHGRFALVISDVHMPKVSGLELLKEVRTREPETPVILMTAAPNQKDEARSKEMGAQSYLSKPCRLAEILNQVQVALVNRVA